MAKYEKLMQNKIANPDDIQDTVQEVRKTRGGAILDPDDLIADVLDCNDFVSIGNVYLFFVLNATIFTFMQFLRAI